MSVVQPVPHDPIGNADWDEWYGDPARWPTSRHVFLADAAMRLARVLCYPWYDELFVAAGEAPIELPRPDLFLQHPEWSPYRDGSGVAATEPDLDVGLWRPDDWTDEEERALIDADVHNNLRHAGRVAVRAIARGLAVLAAGGRITTIAMPLDGSASAPIEPGNWDLLDPIDRIATCRLTPGDRTAPGKDGTHLVFVEDNQLEKRLRAYARENQVALNDAGVTFRGGGGLGAPKQDPEGALVEMCEDAMRAYLTGAEEKDVTRPVLRKEVGDRTKRRFSVQVFERARANLLKDFKELARPGRRPGPQGPRGPRMPRPAAEKAEE